MRGQYRLHDSNSDFLGTSLVWFQGEGQLQQPSQSTSCPPPGDGGGRDGDRARQGLMKLCHLFLNPEGVSGPPPFMTCVIKVFSISGLPDFVPIAHPEQSESTKHPAALINK